MQRHSSRGQVAAIAICLAVLAGCGISQSSTGAATATTTTAPTATATTIPATPTPSFVSTTFTCPATLNGAQKTFSDSSAQFAFSYPASWVENKCQRFMGSDGRQTIFIGNLFSVSVVPRNGQSIQQWVDSQTNQYELVTLTTLTVQQAQAAVSIAVKPSAISDPSRAFDAEPFAQTFAIIEGSHNFYMVNALVAQMSMTDTMPSLTSQPIVTTFVVP